MPPHCDSLDGPVVNAARTALEVGDVALVLPFVRADGEAEVRRVFDSVLPVREFGPEAREVADRLFFETVVRIHRAGEGAPYTGLKPAGLSVGPVIPLAERAVSTGLPDEVSGFLAGVLRDELKRRLEYDSVLAGSRERSLDDARRYVEASLAFQVYAHRIYEEMRAPSTWSPGRARPSRLNHSAPAAPGGSLHVRRY
ncbi:MAG TPA: DUF6448 family protein [Vicinamibacterales bacterium]|nr:DUF6448 family protein [Vicinamibacterales bacterium]